MKIHSAFVVALVLAFAVFAYLAVSFNEAALLAFRGAHGDLNSFLNEFSSTHPTQVRLNFSALYARSELFEILHPSVDLRVFTADPLSCGDGPSSPAKIDSPRAMSVDKSAVLERFLSERKFLPEGFLRSVPLLDENGESYASRLNRDGPPEFRNKAWVERNLAFFRVSELADILRKYHIQSPEFAAISRLRDSDLALVLNSEPVILGKDTLLVRESSANYWYQLTYRVYDLGTVKEALAATDYDIVPVEKSQFCLERSGPLCWTYNSSHLVASLHRYSLTLLIFAGFIFLAFLALYAKYLFEKSREGRKHRVSLQVLSHEFRTPVAAMLLLNERLSAAASRFGYDDQDLVARMGGEIARLQRILEVSRTYLQASGHRLHFNTVEISSLKQWLEDFIAESGSRVQLEFEMPDQPFAVDPFWMRFLLTNLIQNAFAHGAPPVILRVKKRTERVWLTVEDHGQCTFESLRAMTEPFAKSAQSRGMGLGLNIVKYIADEWGSELTFSRHPTAFSLCLGETKT